MEVDGGCKKLDDISVDTFPERVLVVSDYFLPSRDWNLNSQFIHTRHFYSFWMVFEPLNFSCFEVHLFPMVLVLSIKIKTNTKKRKEIVRKLQKRKVRKEEKKKEKSEKNGNGEQKIKREIEKDYEKKQRKG